MSEALVVVGIWLVLAVAVVVAASRAASRLNHHRPAPPRAVRGDGDG